jgi:hypothetical protein
MMQALVGVIVGPVLVGVGLGVVLVVVLAFKLTRWKLPFALTDLRLGKNQAILLHVKLDDLPPNAIERLQTIAKTVFSRNGIDVPVIIITGSKLEMSVVGDGVAATPHQVAPS